MVPGKCTPSSQMTGGITSLRLNERPWQAVVEPGLKIIERPWIAGPFSNGQFDTFRLVAVKQNMSSCFASSTSSRLQMSGTCPLCE